MSVTEVRQALGSWSVQLSEDTPRSVLDSLTYLGHVALLPGRVGTSAFSDNLLTAARYVGVYRGRAAGDSYTLTGAGMAYWLGDEDGKGDVLETAVALNAATFAQTVNALLPPSGSITAGVINSVAGTYTKTHQWETPRSALDYAMETFGAEYRVNNNATLDAGTVDQLYVVTPKAIIMNRAAGRDLQRVALSGQMGMDTDVEDYTTRVVLLAEGEGTNIATGSADATTIPYKDIHGNPVKITRLISESDTPAGSATTRAQLALNRFSGKRSAVSLSTDAYDIKGDVSVGDYVDVYDPDRGFYDLTREVYWEGQPINPAKLRAVEMTWPIPSGWTVAFRDINGNWIDLTPYYAPESGSTSITVGDLPRSINAGGEDIGYRPNLPDSASPAADTTVPAAPAFTGFSTGVYETDDHTLSAVQASWSQPLNIDGSTITDGDHYEIRYRPNAIVGAAVPWDYLAGGYNVDVDYVWPDSSGVAWPNGWSIIWGPNAADFSSSGGWGRVSHATVSQVRGQTYTAVYADAEVLTNYSIPVSPTGASIIAGVVFRRDTTAGTYYVTSVEPNTDGSVTTKLRRWNGSAYVEHVVKKIPGMTHDPAKLYWIKVTFMGGAISSKIWQGVEGDEPEQDTWTYWDGAPLTGGTTARAGLWSYLDAANTNTLPVVLSTNVFQVRSLAPDNVANAYTWDELGSWDAPTSPSVTVTPDWETAFAGWGSTSYTITGLGAGVQYEFQIRAVDAAVPPHQSAWSASSLVATTGDVIAPSTPAAPEVAASLIAVQVVHRLGKSSGGTFNLEQDLTKLEVHASSSPNFFPDPSTKVGDLLANGAMVRAQIPAVGTFKVEQANSVWIRVVAVDRMGNASPASEAVQSSVELIDDAHISDLTVSKVTAGTITATWIMAGAIKTAETGARVEMDAAGIRAYNAQGDNTVEIDATDGSGTFTGTLQTKVNGAGVKFYASSGGGVENHWSVNDSNGIPLDHRVRTFTWDQGGLFGQTYQTSVVRSADFGQDGGKLMLTEGVTVLSHQPDGGNESYLALGNWPGGGVGQGRIYMKGKFERSWVLDNQGAIWANQVLVGAGFGGASYGYGYTMPDYMCPVTTITGTVGETWLITSVSATGFTISWSGTASHRVFTWCPRVESA